MTRNRILLTIVIALLAFSAAAVPNRTRAQSDVITLKDVSIRPEGIAYNAASGTWLVSSTAKGTIYEVAADGSVTPFIEDKDLKATLGLYIDSKTNVLYVVNSNFLASIAAFIGANGGQPQLPPGMTPPANGQLPGANGTPDPQMQQMLQQMMQSLDYTITLSSYDLKTKSRTQRVDLTKVAPAQGIRFANDIATDGDGNAYVTDSIAAVIYRVDPKGTPAFLTDSQFGGQGGPNPMAMLAGGLGVNGIAFTDGMLLINKTSDGTLYKIALSDPSKVIAVKLAEPITGADGMRIRPDGKLAVVSGQKNTLYIVGSADKWTTATIEQKIEIPQGSTAVAFSDKEMFVLSGGQTVNILGGPAGQPGQPPASTSTPTATTIKRIPIK
jgi:sugar lactone lactonase YvrE